MAKNSEVQMPKTLKDFRKRSPAEGNVLFDRSVVHTRVAPIDPASEIAEMVGSAEDELSGNQIAKIAATMFPPDA